MTDTTVTIKLTKSISNSSEEIETSTLSQDTLSSYTPQSLSRITVEIIDADLFDLLSLASLIPSLRKDGINNSQLIIKIPKDANAASIHTAIVLAGLTAESERLEEQDIRVITSNFKPPQASTVAKISTTVKINIDLDDEDMINEDDLLIDVDGLNAPPAMEARAKDDCDGRKPCDDCTCGRAEMEQGNGAGAGAGPEREVIKDLKSACGNCSKGDAFRCAGCPFLGKPAFKGGEEHLVLDLMDDL